ncbi:hypothetical protein H7171_04195 [Candidatus Saccharibacteria bacterium]|nr:hypothetical protein [Candidatus Saccharibacteria bacterium]
MLQNKNIISTPENALAKLAMQASVFFVTGVVMLAGVSHGFEFVSNHDTDKRHTAEGNTVNTGNGSNESRTPREETGPHYTSYGSFSRTPGRSGSF